MFRLDFADKNAWSKLLQPRPSQPSAIRREDVRQTSILLWEEHCHECAIPQCYQTCSLYVRRADQKCARFVYGIYPNQNFSGLFAFGADISFRRWAKLEAILNPKGASVRWVRALNQLNRAITAMVRFFCNILQPINPKRRLNGALALVRQKLLRKFFSGAPDTEYDAFVFESFSPETETFRMILEQRAQGHVLRHAFEIQPGWNLHTLPAQRFKLEPRASILLSPENNAERRLIFTWLDFVQFQPGYKVKAAATERKDLRPAAKVKCVAWDLDNTLWRGVLVEDGVEGLVPVPEALELIRQLDARGIIQTVISRNNFSDAWAMIERLGLHDYFLFPAINWQPKSGNLKEIADKLNIGVDTFALIDDSAFERAEVQTALPQVRVYPIGQMPSLLALEEFDVPVTETAKKRRLSYLTEIKREKERESFSGDEEDFLRSCQLKLRLFIPREERHIKRCLELIQRGNQLNMSSRRYVPEEFNELLTTAGMLCIAMDCRDRFGEYGIVGFASVDERLRNPRIRDMVLSCRVAQRRVEHTFLRWVATLEAQRGKSTLEADLVPTARNTSLIKVFDDLHFVLVSEENGRRLIELPLKVPIASQDLMTLEVEMAHG